MTPTELVKNLDISISAFELLILEFKKIKAEVIQTNTSAATMHQLDKALDIVEIALGSLDRLGG